MRWVLARRSRDGYPLLEVLRSKPPVDQSPELLDVVRARVAVVDVVRVLPHVAGQDGPLAVLDGRAGVARLLDAEAPVGALDQPGPARTKQGDRRVGEFFLEGREPAEALADGIGQRATRLATALGARQFQ